MPAALDQSGGSGGILIIGCELGSGCEVVGIFHGGLECGLVEGNDFIAHAGGSDDAAEEPSHLS